MIISFSLPLKNSNELLTIRQMDLIVLVVFSKKLPLCGKMVTTSDLRFTRRSRVESETRVLLMLLGLLMPTLASVRQTAYRVISAGNQRTIGQGLVIWAGARYGVLPPSRLLEENEDPPMGELLRVYAPREVGAADGVDSAGIVRKSSSSRRSRAWIGMTMHDWDGLGHLFASDIIGASANSRIC